MQAPEVLARGAVVVDGAMLVNDLRFMRRASSRKPLAGRLANCVDTGRRWSDIGDTRNMSLRLPSFVVYPGPDRIITFSPTGGGS